MSHVGSFVPAEWAKKGITDKILTRLVTDDSISRQQSSFLRDLQDLSLFFKQLHREFGDHRRIWKRDGLDR